MYDDVNNTPTTFLSPSSHNNSQNNKEVSSSLTEQLHGAGGVSGHLPTSMAPSAFGGGLNTQAQMLRGMSTSFIGQPAGDAGPLTRALRRLLAVLRYPLHMFRRLLRQCLSCLRIMTSSDGALARLLALVNMQRSLGVAPLQHPGLQLRTRIVMLLLPLRCLVVVVVVCLCPCPTPSTPSVQMSGARAS